MKTLQQHIEEKLIINKKYKDDDCFIYKLDIHGKIKIFCGAFGMQFHNYKDKVYINGEHAELDGWGSTKNFYDVGEYQVKIEDIDEITDCYDLFYNCPQLISVPLFDTSKVKDMGEMFAECKNIENIPLLDTSNVTDMDRMFFGCNNLSEETKRQWSTVYNFSEHNKK